MTRRSSTPTAERVRADRERLRAAQDGRFDATASVTVCALTTDPTEAPLFRLPVTPDETNGIQEPSTLMVDKITTVPRPKLGEKIGRLGDDDMVQLGRAIVVFLGVAGN